MRAARRVAATLAVTTLALFSTLPVAAFNILSFDGRNTVRWRSSAFPLHYEVQENFPATTGTDDQAAIGAAVSTWENLSCGAIDFTFDGYTAGSSRAERDGRNRIVYTTAGFRSTNSGAIGVTYTEFSGDSLGWYLSGADIAINAYTSWSTNPNGNQMDLESVVLHELGHLLGLQHTPILAATMYYATGPGDTSQRSLHADDIAGGCFLYPDGPFRCDSNADCPTLESNDTDSFGNPVLWGRSTCQPSGTCSITGAPPGDPIGSTCAGPADCQSSLCVPSPIVENNVCSSPCDIDVADSCPGGFTCLDYPDEFGDVCVAEGEGQLGDPCETGLECASAVCVGITDDAAVCAEICNPSAIGPCPAGSACFESETPGEGFCLAGGETPFGDPCEASLDCEGSVCLVFEGDAELGVCTQNCSPNNPAAACPDNSACWPGAAEGEYFCVPGGDGPPASLCESSLDCRDALCVPYDGSDQNYRCGLPCEFRAGVNECPEGYQCFPLEVDGVCLPEGNAPLGAGCANIFDCQSLLCLADDDVCTELCTGNCPLGYECVDLTGGLGGCVADGTGPIEGEASPDTGGDEGGGPDGGGEPDGGGVPDAGEPDRGGGGGGGGGGSGGGDGGGCSIAGAPLGGPAWLGLAMGALVVATRRRRRF